MKLLLLISAFIILQTLLAVGHLSATGLPAMRISVDFFKKKCSAPGNTKADNKAAFIALPMRYPNTPQGNTSAFLKLFSCFL